MKKKLSPRKIKANRRNARKSTGPKTPVGKAIVAINALRHGLCSAEVVIPGLEKEEEYEMHRQAMLASLAPKDYLEAEMAEWVALNVWLLRRVARYEREMIAIEQASAPKRCPNWLHLRPQNHSSVRPIRPPHPVSRPDRSQCPG